MAVRKLSLPLFSAKTAARYLTSPSDFARKSKNTGTEAFWIFSGHWHVRSTGGWSDSLKTPHRLFERVPQRARR
jgi:hypothetical protein